MLLLETGHLCQLTRRKGAKVTLGRGGAPASSGDGGHGADLGCAWGDPATQTEGWEEVRPGAPEASAGRPGRHASCGRRVRCEQRGQQCPHCVAWGLGGRTAGNGVRGRGGEGAGREEMD